MRRKGCAVAFCFFCVGSFGCTKWCFKQTLQADAPLGNRSGSACTGAVRRSTFRTFDCPGAIPRRKHWKKAGGVSLYILLHAVVIFYNKLCGEHFGQTNRNGIGTIDSLAVFTAIIAKPLMLKPNERSIKPTLRSSSKPFSVVLASSAVSAVIVCGCVVFFGSMAEMLPKGIGGLLEISAGIARCRSATEAAVLLGFSGVSILCQCSAACNGELDMLPCMTAKVIQAIFMGGIAFFIID